MSRHKVAVVGAVVCTFTAAGCGVGEGSGDSTTAAQQSVSAPAKLAGTITFQTWSLKNDKFTPYFTQLIAAFEKSHAGTKINWIDQPGDGYADKVASQIKSGSLPDVVNLPPEIAYQATRPGALLNLAKSVPTLSTDYVASGIGAYTYPGVDGSYAFPWYLGTDVNYWNKDILGKAGVSTTALPTTNDQLMAAAKKVHDATGGRDYLISRKPGLLDFVAAGVPLSSADGKKFAFNTPAAAGVVDKYVSAYKSGYMPKDALSDTYLGNSALFEKSRVGWTTGTGFFIKDLQGKSPTLAPKVIGSPVIGTPPLYAQGISVAAKSKNLPLALEFAKFATNNTNQLAFTDIATGFLPGTTAAQTDPRFSKSDGTAAGNAAVLAAKALPQAKVIQPPTWTEAMSTYLNQQLALALTGKQSSKDALDKAVSKANSLL
ncbi:sugar ABC transporter substrate-binding protein [Luteipulveratus mongoliensis]|uniref:Sugar ABC transporter substrate-binding protein n=1 Tax=Luteipulveratus mongoliensis TaxID=571913 RepID=A0A0K1JQ66_9MICO|nr:sugar ABC transporter substrate-binding protein [Luteipulveratus mongoliensis]